MRDSQNGLNLKSIDDIRANGFEGFVCVRDLQRLKCCDVPNEPGVYLVLSAGTKSPEFIARSTGGHFKGKDPTAPIDDLQRKWVKGALILNVGKAGAPGKEATLRSRLSSYMGFGQGKRQGHCGGRYIWQLKDVGDLLVCWKRTSKATARETEIDLIREFERQHNGRLPFANLCH